MVQLVIIVLLFGAALGYVARLVWLAFAEPAPGSGCAKGCGSCSAAPDIARRLAEAEARALR